MKRRMVKLFVIPMRIGFGLMLVFASVPKLADPFAFSIAIRNYGVIGMDWARLAAVVMPSLELLTGVLLITGVWEGAAAAVNALLMCGFLTMVGQAFIRGLDISCGCFHLDEGKISAGKVIFNLLLAAASIWLLQLTRKKNKG